VRGGELAVLEGDWEPSRLVVLEFEDLEAAKRWYDSERYRQARTLREGAARLRMVAVRGSTSGLLGPGRCPTVSSTTRSSTRRTVPCRRLITPEGHLGE
jgi:hypothetical protein